MQAQLADRHGGLHIEEPNCVAPLCLARFSRRQVQRIHGLREKLSAGGSSLPTRDRR
jgi:hypothetical protein